MKKITFILCIISLFGFAQQTPAPKQSKSILILGAKAHLGNGQVIENSLISIIDGKITNIGDATVISRWYQAVLTRLQLVFSQAGCG